MVTMIILKNYRLVQRKDNGKIIIARYENGQLVDQGDFEIDEFEESVREFYQRAF